MDLNRTLVGLSLGSSLGCLNAPAVLATRPDLARLGWGVPRAHRDTQGWRLSLGYPQHCALLVVLYTLDETRQLEAMFFT